MSKAQEFPITESRSTLISIRKKKTDLRMEKRIIWLLELQKRRFRTRKELSVYLNDKYQDSGALDSKLYYKWNRWLIIRQAQECKVQDYHS